MFDHGQLVATTVKGIVTVSTWMLMHLVSTDSPVVFLSIHGIAPCTLILLPVHAMY
jgi:hypothetical protein